MKGYSRIMIDGEMRDFDQMTKNEQELAEIKVKTAIAKTLGRTIESVIQKEIKVTN